MDYGDWWDPRTGFNEGFTESWYDSASSIGEALGNSLAGNWDGVGDAYDSGALGQTRDVDSRFRHWDFGIPSGFVIRHSSF